MASADELIQNVVDTMDNACSQKRHLSELLDCLREAKEQIQDSASSSKEKVQSHFESLRILIQEALTVRMTQLCEEIELIKTRSIQPLQQCEDLISEAIVAATTVMEQGKSILEKDPYSKTEDMLKFKDLPETKNLDILPEVPSLSEVPCITAIFTDDLYKEICSLASSDGKIFERAPVQIMEVEERPGALLVKWEEVDESYESSEFCLQYCYGKVCSNESSKASFHHAYTGPNTSHLVKHLRMGTVYSFRVSSRPDPESDWCMWSVPRQAFTNLPHYQWSEGTEGYEVTNENKTATRTSGLARVLYSSFQSYESGHPISFRIMFTGEKSPVDGIAITLDNEDTETLKREGVVFVATDGGVFVDGQEMKTKLPPLVRNSIVTIETETLTNGKVRVSVQVEEKELKFDWKIDRHITLNMIGGIGLQDYSAHKFYFALQFSHEDWKVGVE